MSRTTPQRERNTVKHRHLLRAAAHQHAAMLQGLPATLQAALTSSQQLPAPSTWTTPSTMASVAQPAPPPAQPYPPPGNSSQAHTEGSGRVASSYPALHLKPPPPVFVQLLSLSPTHPATTTHGPTAARGSRPRHHPQTYRQLCPTDAPPPHPLPPPSFHIPTATSPYPT